MVRREITKFGTIIYYNEQNQYHREDGPAVESPGRYKSWYIDGLRHRIDGAAIEYIDGNKSYLIMGKIQSYEEWLAIKDFPLLWE